MTEYETVTVYQDRYIPVPEGLTNAVEIVQPPEVVDTIALGASLKACLVRIKQANGQLEAIRNIEVDE